MKQHITHFNRVIWGWFIALLFVAATATAQTATYADAKELALFDEPYGPHTLHKMDVYLHPKRTRETPLVILVHGGGWMNGDKEACNFMKDFLYPQGFNIININYRLANQTDLHYQEIMDDIDLAISHILTNADEWLVRKDKYILWGGSAGGHLAMLYAYKYDRNDVVGAVTTLGGPTRLDDPETLKGARQSDLEGLLPIITGDPWKPGAFAPSYRAASPYYAKTFKPTLLMHGEADVIVPVAQARTMYAHLQELKVPSELITLPNGGHGGEGTPPDMARHMAGRILEWVKKYGK
ncbi:alpha/beta hydrolase [Dyadobacter jiangsuensis]|uniref:Acetyl esterase/lipase n=1 Tax=Dyadobacter jiangsuensis TaxID=1591085 RepID=A0A2P8GB86_9BACT|nr:alpha/beta hydrolase [Dyadobacter jiangsuensis]PSL31227.1 acetyl esterase/lipase [Dyadobacter jiangsuensis]